METDKYILLVEDEQQIAKAYTEHLTRQGFVVTHAIDGIQGLEKMKQKKPSLVLLDIIMPRLDGVEMYKKMQEDKTLKDIPVMILTNLSDAHKLSEAISLGVTDYLIKSDWSLEDLTTAIKKKLHI